MGNITYLAEKVLDESDWRLGKNNAAISQTKEEPLYEITLKTSIDARDMQGKAEDITISAGQKIFGFYSVVSN
jgi:hypothetical protein